jgi:hypothetical protein
MTEIASEKSTTIIFPFPIEMLRAFGGMYNQAKDNSPKEDKPSTPPK